MFSWRCRNRRLTFSSRPAIMGILNVTPDSFSDGGQHHSLQHAISHGERLIAEGADILDIGGESTRPGSAAVSAEEELCRVLPVVQHFANRDDVLLSIDTMKHTVAAACLAAGADMINDVTAGTFDERLPEVVLQYQAGYAIMHMQGTPRTMQTNPQYDDVTREVRDYLAQRIAQFVKLGFSREMLAVDPGIGFGKTTAHNLELVRHLGTFSSLGCAVLLGVSRKRFIGEITGKPVEDRAAGSLAVACWAAAANTAQILRVHDVGMTRDAMLMLEAISKPPQPVQ